MSDLSKRLAELTPEQRELLLRKIKKSAKVSQSTGVPRRKNQSSYPLSDAQLRLWFLDQLDSESPFYNMPSAIRLKGELNSDMLEKSIQAVIERHEVLRSYYKTDSNGEPQQSLDKFRLELEHIDLTENKDELDKNLKQLASIPFKIEKAPLLKSVLIKLSKTENVLFINFHHIICDGFSVSIFIQEVIQFYRQFVNNTESLLNELNIQYADYAEWQNEKLTSEKISEQLKFWEEYLNGMPPVLELPVDFRRPQITGHKGKHYIFDIDSSLTQKIRAFAMENQTSMFALLLASIQAFLFRISGQEDFGVGIPLANRKRREIEQLIGFFVNTAVIRANFTEKVNFKQMVEKAKNDVLRATENQDIPFERVVEKVQPKRELSHSPLFQVMFDFQQLPFEKLSLDDLTIELQDINIEVAKFDLLFLLTERKNEISFTLEYNTDLFRPDSVRRLAGYLSCFLENLFSNPDLPIDRIDLITTEEKNNLLHKWNNTQTDYPKNKSLPFLFSKQVLETPDYNALEFDDLTLTYKQLNQKANQLAQFLIKKGVKANDRVALLLERDAQMFISILAVIKANAIYVPIDTAYPAERIRFILEDTDVEILITNNTLGKLADKNETKIIFQENLDDNLKDMPEHDPVVESVSDSGAYIIYTSGSTGQPKGVLVPHRAITRLVINTNYISVNKGDRIVQISNAAFDAATFEIWGALLNGATLVGIKKEVMLSMTDFIQTLADKKINHMFITTALFNQIATTDVNAFSLLKTVLFGGEICDPRIIRQVVENKAPDNLLHVYGPTENTTFSTWYKINDVPDNALTVPIGLPLANSTCYVLNENRQPQPVGIPGELYVGGDGLALSYYNRPELTSDKFIEFEIADNKKVKVYKTGDLVRYLPDGNIEFIGRIDQQVKIRGFRIELGEIESFVKEHPAINDAVVTLYEKTSADKQLVAYYSCENQQKPAAIDIRKFLSHKLPDYMLPDIYMQVEKIPLNPNGKVDKKALPEPKAERLSGKETYIAPRDEFETYLTEIWQDLLGIEKISIYDNFFELGGNSLKAAVLINRLQEDIKQSLHVGMIFKAPTIAEFALFGKEYFYEVISERFADLGSKENIYKDTISDANIITKEKVNSIREIIKPLKDFSGTHKNTKPNPKAVFILSPPRSGSTLLRIMLAGNPALFSPPELDLLSFNTFKERNTFFRENSLDIWLEATQRALMELKNINAEAALHEQNRYEENNISIKDFYFELQKELDGRLLVDKTPSYAFDLATLERAEKDFDQPYYIHLVRHPYAMVYSFIEAKLDLNFFKYEHPFSRQELAELVWIISHQNIKTFFNKIPMDRQIQVYFENILTNPREELNRICNFLNIPFSEEMLEPYQGNKMTEGVSETSQMVGDFKFYLHSGINSEVANKWRRLHEIDFLSDIAWDIASAFNYPVEKNIASRRNKILLGSIPKIDRKEKLQLSFAQQRLWFIEHLDPGNSQYNIPGAARIQGPLSTQLLEKALNNIIERHEILRTVFLTKDGQAELRIFDKLNAQINFFDYQELNEEAREKKSINTH